MSKRTRWRSKRMQQQKQVLSWAILWPCCYCIASSFLEKRQKANDDLTWFMDYFENATVRYNTYSIFMEISNSVMAVLHNLIEQILKKGKKNLTRCSNFRLLEWCGLGWPWFAWAAQEFSAQLMGACCDITNLKSTYTNPAPASPVELKADIGLSV